MSSEFQVYRRMSEVPRMKSLKTYNMDRDVIEILQPVKNKSQFICAAVRRMKNGEDAFDLSDVSSRQLLAVISYRKDVPEGLKAQIIQILTSSGS